MTRDALLTVVFAVTATVMYALSNVLQTAEAEQLSDDDTLSVGILAKLARRPRWLVGMGADVGGYLFEALALGIGTLVVVEPILSTALLVSLFLGSVLHHRTIDRNDWIAALILASGVAIFLYQVEPTGGRDFAPREAWAVAIPLVLAMELVCITMARGSVGPRRAAFLGTGAGVAFGVSAVLTKAFVTYLSHGVFAWVPHWEPYGLAVASIGGLVLSQSAFQTGALAAAVGAEQVWQPFTGVALGVWLLDEQLRTPGPVANLLVVMSLAMMAIGVVTLANRTEGGTEPNPLP